ncbi:MAG: caspase family protein [Alphaproteobacteria bacterium]|nr:caspase family protein [Alphaproteobacteria bacterium]MCB9692731.1 caspase family protein [Alphaproteobacteria bacterium]
MTIPLLIAATALAQDDKPTVPAAEAHFVAVVIGLSSYENIPDPVELDFARSDAAVVEKALRERAGFDKTFLIADGKATKNGVRELLRTEVAQLVGPNDLFLLYFVGHGIGADLDQPALLAYDSTVETVHEDGFELNAFAQDIATFAQAGTTLIVTDAIHSNQLDGVYFFGPAANQWPQMRPNTMILSSSQADSPARDGAFGTVFADAMAGAADANTDGFVTTRELKDYLVGRVSTVGQIPVAAGDYKQNTVVARDVAFTAPTDASHTNAPIPDANATMPDTLVWSAKFVFREGASQTVECRDQQIKSCAPSCYVRSFKSGICNLSAVVDGAAMKGQVAVVYPGKYDCGLRYGSLTCRPPIEPAQKD